MGICSLTQVCAEARVVRCPGDGVMDNLCELPNMVLGSDLEFTVRAMYALHHRAVTPAPNLDYLDMGLIVV